VFEYPLIPGVETGRNPEEDGEETEGWKGDGEDDLESFMSFKDDMLELIPMGPSAGVMLGPDPLLKKPEPTLLG
jgi:hypothetical protein